VLLYEICNMSSKKLGDKIRKLRAMKGYSQANVAEDLGITPGAYAKIERGEIDPNTSRLYEIAKSLDVSITDFFDDKTRILAKETKPEYGYATKSEVADLAHAILKLTKAVERIEEQLPKKTLRQAQGSAAKKVAVKKKNKK
jgi:transcriptional regulator with XRE-family HTH domain